MTDSERVTAPPDAAPAAPDAPAAGGRRSAGTLNMRGAAVSLLREAALVPALVLLVIIGTIVSPVFLTSSNLTGIGEQISSLGVIVVGESLILLTSGMDLSLESTYGLVPMLAAALILPRSDYGFGTDWTPALGLVVIVVVGAGIGLFNGLLIVKARLNGFIVTLAMVIVLEGLQSGIVSAQSLYNLPASFTDLGAATVNGFPISLIACVIIFVVGLFLRYHRHGRAIYAVGGNIQAARAAGINVDRVRIGCYVAGSVLAAIGGLIESGRVLSVTATQGYGEGIIFPVFAAAVIGGVSLKGGRGNMIGAASGVILLGIVQNILNLGNVSSYWIDAINGSVILLALVVTRVVGGAENVE